MITEADVEIAPQFVSSDEHIVIETIKPAEDGNGIVVRLYEDSGIKRTASLSIAVKGKAFEADMKEIVDGVPDFPDTGSRSFGIGIQAV